MKFMKFSDWKRALNVSGRNNFEKATSVVINAYVSRRQGELGPLAFKAAINWAYRLDHGAALLEERRQESRAKRLTS